MATQLRARALLALVPAAAMLSCGTTPTTTTRCLQLTPSDDGLTTAPPAKVSLFFSMDTCGGEPVGGLSAQQFSIQEDGSPVSPYESQQTIQPKGQNYRMYSLLLLDLSGSILRSGSFDALRDAAHLYVDEVLGKPGDGQQIAVAFFDGRPGLNPVVGFSGDAAQVKAAIDALQNPQCTTDADCAAFADHRSCAGWLCVDDSTNLNGAVVQGIEQLEQQLQQDPSIQFKDAALVVMTDGTDEAGRVSTQTATAKVNSTKVHVFTVGLGGDVDPKVLQAFGKDGFEPASQAAELSKAFSAIADRIVSLSSSFYLLEYCSPKRTGKHTLTVTASWTGPDHKVLTGSLTRSFDATGFQSGCHLP